MPTLICCHQPYFLPALSFFAKWAASDGLVLLDQAQYVSNSAKFHYANRCALEGAKWCTIPIVRSFEQRMCDMAVAPGWKASSLIDRIRNDYRKTPHVDEVVAGLRNVISGWADGRLSTLNIALIRWAGDRLLIKSPVWVQSDLFAEDVEDRDERLVRLVTAVGGKAYLAGPSGRKYMRTEVYQNAGIELKTAHFQVLPYPRSGREWFPYLSVVDVLCHRGPESAQFAKAEVTNWAD